MIVVNQPAPAGYLGARIVSPMSQPKPVFAPIKRQKKIRPLTEAQKKMLRFLANFHSVFGWMPSFTEAADGMGFSGVAAVSSVLEALEKKGAIVRGEHGASRCIRIVISETEFN